MNTSLVIQSQPEELDLSQLTTPLPTSQKTIIDLTIMEMDEEEKDYVYSVAKMDASGDMNSAMNELKANLEETCKKKGISVFPQTLFDEVDRKILMYDTRFGFMPKYFLKCIMEMQKKWKDFEEDLEILLDRFYATDLKELEKFDCCSICGFRRHPVMVQQIPQPGHLVCSFHCKRAWDKMRLMYGKVHSRLKTEDKKKEAKKNFLEVMQRNWGRWLTTREGEYRFAMKFYKLNVSPPAHMEMGLDGDD